MSTKTTHHGEYGTDYKVLYLNAAQVPVYEEARDIIEFARGEELTEGEVVRELCRSFFMLSGKQLSPVMMNVVDDHASENNDPVFSLDELEAMDAKRIRRLAANANSQNIGGKSTRVEMYSYFADTSDLPDTDES